MARHDVAGSLPEIIRDDADLYEGHLEPYFADIFLDATNLRGPYHNFRHMLHVPYRCYDALRWYRRYKPDGIEISPRQGRILMVAAIHHDVDHTNKGGNDDANIERAVAFLRRHVLDADRSLLPDIENTIRRATHYPHTVDGSALSTIEGVLRDADMTQALERVWIQEIIFGLGQEIGQDQIPMLRMQKKFLRTVEANLCTPWAKATFTAEDFHDKIEEAEALLAIVEKEQAHRAAPAANPVA